MADLAIWMAGHVTVPVYPSLKASTVRQILEHSGSKACFLGATDEQETADAIPSGVSCIGFPTAPAGAYPAWERLISGNPPMAGQPTRPADDLATIIYTSGTTGAPKGVMHSFASMRFVAKSLIGILGLTAEQRVLSYLPLAHIVERVGMETPSLLLGSRIFFAEGVETFLADLQRARSTLFLSVPRLLLKFQQRVFERIPKTDLDRLLRIPILNRSVKKRILRQLGLDTVRHAACGAAPLPPEILLWFRKLGLNLAEGYGMTETLITHLPRPGSVRPGYVGQALSGVQLKLGENSELLVKSPMNMLGYFNDPARTKEAFTEDGFFRTGDVVQLEPDGQLRIVGRAKEQFKTSKGKYVAPAPIESRFMEHPAVEACCLMGAGLPSPFAVVLLSDEIRKRCAAREAQKTLEQSLRATMEEMNARLDPHERVHFIAIADGPWTVGNGLMTPTLKIKRTALESRYQGYVDAWERYNTPVVWESVPQAT
jgi:long-chain acyl-CoA synthetase